MNYKERYPSIVLVKNLCANFENIFQHMGIDLDDEDLMDDEIEEAMFEMSSRWEELVETRCYTTQDHSQQAIISPLSKNETDMHLNDESHVTTHDINEDLQQVCHFLCVSEKYQGSQINCSSVLSFSETTCTRNLNSKPIYDIESHVISQPIYVTIQT
jgi:hypothetical protein